MRKLCLVFFYLKDNTESYKFIKIQYFSTKINLAIRKSEYPFFDPKKPRFFMCRVQKNGKNDYLNIQESSLGPKFKIVILQTPIKISKKVKLWHAKV